MKIFKSALTFLLASFFISASAQETIENRVPFTAQINEVYQFTTASQSGPLEVRLSESNHINPDMIYTDASCTTPLPQGVFTYPAKYTFNIQANTTYYFRYSKDTIGLEEPPVSITVTIAWPDPDLQSTETVFTVTPAPGTNINTSDHMVDIAISFTSALSRYGNVYLTYTSLEGEEVNVPITGKFLELVAQNQVLVLRVFDANLGTPTIYEEMRANADTDKPWFVNVENISFGNGSILGEPGNTVDGYEYIHVNDGVLTLQYAFIDPPTIVNQTWPEVFYNDFTEGAEGSQAILEFNQPIANIHQVSIFMGHKAWGTPPGEDAEQDPAWRIKPEINDNVVTINFADINYSEYINKDYSEVTIFISNIISTSDLIYPLITHYIPFVNESQEEAGVESIIDKTPAAKGVYNLQGIKVADTPEALPAGLYIYNGRKIKK